MKSLRGGTERGVALKSSSAQALPLRRRWIIKAIETEKNIDYKMKWKSIDDKDPLKRTVAYGKVPHSCVLQSNSHGKRRIDLF